MLFQQKAQHSEERKAGVIAALHCGSVVLRSLSNTRHTLQKCLEVFRLFWTEHKLSGLTALNEDAPTHPVSPG
jgi:hypothetical protein